MTVELKHATVATGTDAGNGEIAKAEWNENHNLTGTANAILAFDGSGNASELTPPAGDLVGTTATQTVTNKTITYADNTLTGVQASLVSGTSIKSINSTSLLASGDLALVAATSGTASGLTLNDGYTEEVFAVTGTTPALSPTNGSIQTWTLSGNSTPTAGTWAEGQSITMMIDDGSAYTITWTTLGVVWKTDAGSAPTLNTSGFTAIALWKVGSTIYGARVGDA
ncbi:MAG: hypothetical protein RLZZ602_1599 [Pseudomonadota bacterium]|jgi:hypothetical protein